MTLRLERLRRRLNEAPEQPLVLALGSSRMSNGFRPPALADWAPPGQPAPVVFNFATPGSGPVLQLLTLQRLLARGIRPSWVLVEVFPPFWPQLGFFREEDSLRKIDTDWADLPVVAQLYPHLWWEVFSKVCRESLTPHIYYRADVLDNSLASLQPRDRWEGRYLREGLRLFLDDSGWLPLSGPGGPQQVARRVADGRGTVQAIFERFRIDPVSDRALRWILAECRRQDIKPALVLLPECAALRSCYPAAVRREVQDYLTRLARQDKVPVFDTRDWVGDDNFFDCFHLHAAGPTCSACGSGARSCARCWEAGRCPCAHCRPQTGAGPTRAPALPAPTPVARRLRTPDPRRPSRNGATGAARKLVIVCRRPRPDPRPRRAYPCCPVLPGRALPRAKRCSLAAVLSITIANGPRGDRSGGG
jgi:hypothetical protein